MKSVFVIGVTGFIGRYVAHRFAQKGWKVLGLGTRPPENAPQQDLTGYYQLILPSDDLNGLVQLIQPQMCIHCAGRASVANSLNDPLADFKAQVEITFNVLNAMRLGAPRCRLIYLSSAAVYGNPESLPIMEDHPLRPVSPYGFHKLIGEKLCAEFSEIYGVPTAIVRIFSAYGTGLRRQVIADLCYKALTEPVLRLHGTGSESRDFINVRDVAQGIYLLAEGAPCQAEAYNLASGRETTIKELAELVVALSGRKIAIDFDRQNPKGNPLNWQADISRMSQLEFVPTITLEKGLKAYADWCRIEVLGP
jgi:UDP-glucose 4-epimerase